MGIAAALASAALLTGCVSGSGSTDAAGPPSQTASTGLVNVEENPGTPVSGGTLSFAGYSMPSSLDPSKTQPAGATGGTEMASIYDLLVRYDASRQEYVPQLAESLTESPDHLTWTIGLRDGITFSDGTPLDAQAVIASIDRFNAQHGPNSAQWMENVAGTAATDPHTVQITLNAPWNALPAMLTFGHGMIVAPAAYADPGNFTPIGAGPFTVTSFAPASSLELAPRADYWDGSPYLDSLKFVDIAGDQPRVEALRSGGIQMTFLRSAKWIDEMIGSWPGFHELMSLGWVIPINVREGHPGADPRVRKAIALAIDPDVINQRAFAGDELPTTKIFPEWSRWHNDVPGYTLDTAKASQLVAGAKADGFDGDLVFLTVNTPEMRSVATAAQAMLNAVGFNVDVQYAATVTDMVKRMYVDYDFDLAVSSNSVSDPLATLRLPAALSSTSANNISGYSTPDMDRLLAEAKSATTPDQQKSALRAVEQTIHDEVPMVSVSSGENFVAWSDDVHGVLPSNDSIVLLGKTWIG